MSAFTSSFTVAPRAAHPTAARATVKCSASAGRREALSAAFAAGLALLVTPAARADLTADLLASTAANKALNDKKRLATSGANFARSRTVTDGSCAFPNNWVGCENAAETGSVKYLSDDLNLECEGVADGKICPAKAKGSFPSPFGV